MDVPAPATLDAVMNSATLSSQIVDTEIASKRKLKVTIKKWHGVAKWTWGCGEGEVCGICQVAFEGVAPGVKYPGDECPVVFGVCRHSFHLQCISMWLQGGQTTCPICRSEWEFGADSNGTGSSNNNNRMNTT